MSDLGEVTFGPAPDESLWRRCARRLVAGVSYSGLANRESWDLDGLIDHAAFCSRSDSAVRGPGSAPSAQ
ncbi:hypothetical protein GCM10009606_23090 [Nocardioides aquiterrae]|uniref:Uncharacterized protein n=1 Tax=Nocardioides aquiterrae TaxID=203799 RepID=A0ABP4EXB6_9ACTN